MTRPDARAGIPPEEPAVAADADRRVELSRVGHGRFRATNARGGELTLGYGQDADFTPVELLLAAIAGCSAIDVDFITGKRSTPSSFEVTAAGDKIRDEHGNRLVNLSLEFRVTFPPDEAGARAAAVLERSVHQSHDRLCTVSRTVELPSPIAVSVR
jgi:putative redox protein